MRRIVTLAAAAATLAFPAAAPAFHHAFVPASQCAAAEDASNNPTARTAIREHNPAQTLPLPPAGTPGAGQGQGAEHCANAGEA